MDKPLPKVGGAGTNQGPVSPKSSPSKPSSESHSGLAADMLKAQQDLAAAAGGKKVPVDDGDDTLSPTGSSVSVSGQKTRPADDHLGLSHQPTDQPSTDDVSPTPVPPATGPVQPVKAEPDQKREEQTPVSGPKEQRELGPVTEPEKTPLTEYKEPEPGPEVKDWMEKLEEGESVQLPQPVTDDYGQVLVQAAGKPKPKIVLPLDEEELSQGLHQKVVSSMRWLAEWCVRVMKKAAGRVFYKPTEEKA